MFSEFDRLAMTRALALAERGLETTHPNPRVGCVIAKGDRVIAEGWHERAGEPHAEVMALRAAKEPVAGATAYVTLEPCSHQGRTPPCANALIEARLGRVVFAVQDPNPRVSGQGADLLLRAGIAVEAGLMQAEATELNVGFMKRMKDCLPFVRVKLAMSLDGRTALANGASQWITGEAARADVQRWRARSSAVMTGVGTLLADDPQLNVRLGGDRRRQPLRVVLDSGLRTPVGARVFGGGGVGAGATGVLAAGEVLIFAAASQSVSVPRKATFEGSAFVSSDDTASAATEPGAAAAVETHVKPDPAATGGAAARSRDGGPVVPGAGATSALVATAPTRSGAAGAPSTPMGIAPATLDAAGVTSAHVAAASATSGETTLSPAVAVAASQSETAPVGASASEGAAALAGVSASPGVPLAPSVKAPPGAALPAGATASVAPAATSVATASPPKSAAPNSAAAASPPKGAPPAPATAGVMARASVGSSAALDSSPAAFQARRAALTARGARVIEVPADEGLLDLFAVLEHLAKLEVNEVLVEAGATLAGQLLTGFFVDELMLYVAPKLLGPQGRPLVNLPELQSLQDAWGFSLFEAKRFGDDLRLRMRPK